MLRRCTVCPQTCGNNRLEDERAFCRTGRRASVASAGPHFGEEGVLVGSHGSGTIFFANCNLACAFCQNCEISHGGEGEEVDARDLAGIMLRLQRRGCHNINLVSPSHVVPQILEALEIAAPEGLEVPLVWNTGGYDALPSLRLLDGIVDIYMPDMKFADGEVAERVAAARGYPRVNRLAVREMHRQVGDLRVDDRGLAYRGLLVRHLVLPGGLAGTEEIVGFIAREVSPDTYINIMDQYFPYYRADRHPPLGRRPTREEYRAAVRAARQAGLWRFAE